MPGPSYEIESFLNVPKADKMLRNPQRLLQWTPILAVYCGTSNQINDPRRSRCGPPSPLSKCHSMPQLLYTLKNEIFSSCRASETMEVSEALYDPRFVGRSVDISSPLATSHASCALSGRWSAEKQEVPRKNKSLKSCKTGNPLLSTALALFLAPYAECIAKLRKLESCPSLLI